jgi:hypothetical protein
LWEAPDPFGQTRGWLLKTKLKLETFSWNIRQNESVVIHLENKFCE